MEETKNRKTTKLSFRANDEVERAIETLASTYSDSSTTDIINTAILLMLEVSTNENKTKTNARRT